jgi:hypothetical protein
VARAAPDQTLQHPNPLFNSITQPCPPGVAQPVCPAIMCLLAQCSSCTNTLRTQTCTAFDPMLYLVLPSRCARSSTMTAAGGSCSRCTHAPYLRSWCKSCTYLQRTQQQYEHVCRVTYLCLACDSSYPLLQHCATVAPDNANSIPTHVLPNWWCTLARALRIVCDLLEVDSAEGWVLLRYPKWQQRWSLVQLCPITDEHDLLPAAC